MNWARVEEQLKQVSEQLHEKLAKLTADDLRRLQRRKAAFLGRLQESPVQELA